MSRQMKMMVLAVCLGTVLSMTSQSLANVNAGLDYFHTINGTSFDFGGDIGIVEFKGEPLDPPNLHNTDTIVERLQDAELPHLGSSDTIPIEMVALSLVSIEPVKIDGLEPFFDIFIVLDLGSDLLPDTGDETPSLGEMTIRHENNWPDDGMNTAEGTFSSLFSLFLDALFVPVGQTEPAFTQDIDNLPLGSEGAMWTHSHDAVPSLPGASNFFLAAIPNFPLGLIVEEHPGVGVHTAENTTPEPATIMLLGLGAALVRRRNGYGPRNARV